MAARVTTTTWGVGATNALICGVCVLAAWGVLAGGVVLITDRTLGASLDLAFTLLWGFLLSQIGAFWFYGRRIGTPVLRAKGYFAKPRGALPVPLEHREAVNAFLLGRAPQARET